MKHKIAGSLLFVILLAGKGYSQLDNFNLSDYKLPNLKWKSRDTYYSVSGTIPHFPIIGITGQALLETVEQGLQLQFIRDAVIIIMWKKEMANITSPGN